MSVLRLDRVSKRFGDFLAVDDLTFSVPEGLIFGFLGNILQLKNIDSNTQLVLKGLIILTAVLLQEGQIAVWWKRIRTRLTRPDASSLDQLRRSEEPQTDLKSIKK